MNHPSSPAVEAVIFDIGGVLFQNIQEFFLPDLARRYALDPELLLSLGYRHGALWGLGRATEESYWRGILTDAGLDLSLLPGLVEETDRYIRHIPETWDLVRSIAPSVRVGILSNTTWEWVRRLRAVEEWEGRFDPVLLSCEVGLCKPDLAIFGLLLERLELPGERVLFVDDRDDNLAAAAALGIQGHLFTDPVRLRQRLAPLLDREKSAHELRFLGTAASEAYPDAFCDCANCCRAREVGGRSLRRRSAALIDDVLLIDFGPDLMAAALMDSLSLAQVRVLPPDARARRPSRPGALPVAQPPLRRPWSATAALFRYPGRTRHRSKGSRLVGRSGPHRSGRRRPPQSDGARRRAVPVVRRGALRSPQPEGGPRPVSPGRPAVRHRAERTRALLCH